MHGTLHTQRCSGVGTPQLCFNFWNDVDADLLRRTKPQVENAEGRHRSIRPTHVYSSPGRAGPIFCQSHLNIHGYVTGARSLMLLLLLLLSLLSGILVHRR